VDGNTPLAMWSNRWSTMPIHSRPELRLPRPDRRAELAFMPGSDVPVIRQPFAPGDLLPFWAYGVEPDRHWLHDLGVDPWQLENRVGESTEPEAVDRLRTALREVDAPAEQFARLALS
jgi:hypothetical protein